jgi:hypothetical protein
MVQILRSGWQAQQRSGIRERLQGEQAMKGSSVTEFMF